MPSAGAHPAHQPWLSSPQVPQCITSLAVTPAQQLQLAQRFALLRLQQLQIPQQVGAPLGVVFSVGTGEEQVLKHLAGCCKGLEGQQWGVKAKSLLGKSTKPDFLPYFLFLRHDPKPVLSATVMLAHG